MPTGAERLVADTNVLVSAALRNDTPPRQVLDTVQHAGGFLVFSDETFAEVHDRISKPKFDRYVTHEKRAPFPASWWPCPSGYRSAKPSSAAATRTTTSCSKRHWWEKPRVG